MRTARNVPGKSGRQWRWNCAGAYARDCLYVSKIPDAPRAPMCVHACARTCCIAASWNWTDDPFTTWMDFCDYYETIGTQCGFTILFIKEVRSWFNTGVNWQEIIPADCPTDYLTARNLMNTIHRSFTFRKTLYRENVDNTIFSRFYSVSVWAHEVFTKNATFIRIDW